MRKIRIAINGFGRIGRTAFQKALEKESLEVIAINDLADVNTLAHLLKYDSIYGIYKEEVKSSNEIEGKSLGKLIVGNKKFKVFAEKDPSNLPWKDLEIDIVLECTGFFINKEGAEKHLLAGAKKVIISAPSKSEDVNTFVLGVNQEKYDSEKNQIISCASCTTNALAPIVKVVDDHFEIEKALMTTIHSYTSDQRLVDAPHKDLRRARAANLSLIPTTTGATKAVVKTLPHLKGKLDGIAIRVPTPIVSLVDLIAKTKKKTSKDEVKQVFQRAAQEDLKGILQVIDLPLVSIDFRKNEHSAIVDLNLIMVEDQDLVKVFAWYDNEWGYSCRLVDLAEYIGKKNQYD